MHVVVWDPQGKFWEGSLIEDERAAQLDARGVVSLPVEASLFARSGVGGFMKRAWGAGWRLNFNIPKLSCPLCMYVRPDMHRVCFAARLVLDEQTPTDPSGLLGSLRFVTDSGQPSAQLGGYIADPKCVIDVSQLGPMDEHGGWSVKGEGKLFAQSDGYVGTGIYGSAPGLRIAWAAVALSP